MTNDVKAQLNNIIQDDAVAAIVMRQHLKPVEGEMAVIFPPTYLKTKNDVGYNIDTIGQSQTICTIDSVGAQANRMEPIFKNPPYCDLVPKITVEIRKPPAKGQDQGELIDEVNLLDAGHRIADAVVRFSDKTNDIDAAFQAIKKRNASVLAKLAPTSLVFGCWDSRGSSVKIPRIVRSTIRAHNANEITRYAQYFAPVKHYEEAGVEKKKLDKQVKGKKKGSKIGFYDNPSGENPGGVFLDSGSQILRDAVLSLSALRALRAENDENPMNLRRYIFGLSLVAITAPQKPLLRMGCELTSDPNKPATWERVYCDGTRTPFTISHDDSIAFAQAAAHDFGVGESKVFVFDPKKANAALDKETKQESEEE